MNQVNTIAEAINNLEATSIALEKISYKQHIYNTDYAAYLEQASKDASELAYTLRTFDFVYGGI